MKTQCWLRPWRIRDRLLSGIVNAALSVALSVGLLWSTIVLGQSNGTPTTASFAIRKVRVFDGERVLPSVDVVVRDGRISAVGRNLAIPAGVQVIEGGPNRTLLPGLIDAHTHSFGTACRDALRGDHAARHVRQLAPLVGSEAAA